MPYDYNQINFLADLFTHDAFPIDCVYAVVDFWHSAIDSVLDAPYNALCEGWREVYTEFRDMECLREILRVPAVKSIALNVESGEKEYAGEYYSTLEELDDLLDPLYA